MDTPAPSPEMKTAQSPTPPPDPAEGIWVRTLGDDCLDDMTLPPGGGSRKPPPDAGDQQGRVIPRPEYLSHEGRDLRLDLIRGYFVVAMIVDHVRGASPLYLITGGNRFYTSAAEGFILTSGLVAGIVYRRLMRRDGLAPTLIKVLSRAFTLYLLTVGLTLFFTTFSEFTALPWAQGIDLTRPVEWVLNVFTLHRTYYLVDVMLLYTVLFLLSPLALILMERGKWYYVLLAAWLLYILYQFFPNSVQLPWTIDGNYLFNFSAWQVLFFSGLVLGFHQQRIPALSCCATRIGLVSTAILTAALIALFYLVDTPTSLTPSQLAGGSPIAQEVRLWLQDNLFAKVDLRPGRLLVSAVVFSFFFFAVTQFWKPVKKLVGWLLLPLGQFALYGYTAHVLLVGAVALALKPFKLPYPGPQWLNLLIQVASVMLIWYLAKRQFINPNARTQRWWNLSPVAMGAVLAVLLSTLPPSAFPNLVVVTPPPASQGRVPTRYGTPVPREGSSAPEPPPQASQPSVTLPGTDILSSEWLEPTQGSVHERWFYSPELDRDMPYIIYLPPDYTQASRRYPVLYMLHGLGGHREEWVVYGLLNIADREISAGNIPPMIIVLPQGDKGYWANHTADGPRWGEYLSRDVIAMIDSTYRTLRSPQSRAIGGLSMGGWGALHHAFLRPDLFGIVGAHSTSLRPDDGTLSYLGTGEEFESKNPMTLAQTAVGIENLRIWIDTGETDDWAGRAAELAQRLRDRGLDPILQIYPGGHDYNYWSQHGLDYVRFYGNALAQQ